MTARQPVATANARRNALAPRERARRWQPSRDALWAAVEPYLDEDAQVAIVGAGNCDDVPLTRIAARAGHVDLLDIDERASRAAIRREPRYLRRRLSSHHGDATGGLADEVIRAATRTPPGPPPDLRFGAEYELVIGDLLYTQLLYPALLDAGLDGAAIDAVLERDGPRVTRAAVDRIHGIVQPGGVAIHVHDPVAWWDGHPQPFTLDDVLALANDHPACEALIATGDTPMGCDPEGALAELGIVPERVVYWHWPFTDGVDYVARATVVRVV